MVVYDREDLLSGRISWTELTAPDWRDQDARLGREMKRPDAWNRLRRSTFGRMATAYPS
jgi:hypothetical protein